MFNRVRWGVAPVPPVQQIPRRKPKDQMPKTRKDFAKTLAYVKSTEGGRYA